MMHYAVAVLSTVGAWFVGLLLDANLKGEPLGFAGLRLLLPLLAMGICLLRAISAGKKDS